MKGKGIKLHETRRHTFIILFVAVICILLGFQGISGEVKDNGLLAIIAGVGLIGVAIYMFVTPMIVMGDDSILFKSANAQRKELPYSEIESFSLRENKQLTLKLKGNEEKKNDKIVINYLNLDKKNQDTLIAQLNIKGIEQIVIIEPEKKKGSKK